MEGDSCRTLACTTRSYFYPRPPGGGRPYFPRPLGVSTNISIHALRVEGDTGNVTGIHTHWISIHALRVEGDAMRKASNDLLFIFLSTPSGWRATQTRCGHLQTQRFLSTPSGWRATLAEQNVILATPVISIHALRVEGDGDQRTDDGKV